MTLRTKNQEDTFDLARLKYFYEVSDLPAVEIYTGEQADMVTENGGGGVSGGEDNKISYH